MGPSQLWEGCPFVAILNVPRQPSQSASFLLTFSSAIIGKRSVTDPSRQLSTGAAFVLGMPHRHRGGWEIGMGRGGGKIGAGAICYLKVGET